MQDVNQILIWEKRRKSLQWWNSLTQEQKVTLTTKWANISESEIEQLYTDFK